MRTLRSFGLVTAALLAWAAAANAQPVITTGSIPSGEATVPYSQGLSASDSDETATCCTWAVTSGTAQLVKVNFQPLPPSTITLSDAQIARIKG